MADIICLASTRWCKIPTRTQRLLTQLNRSHKILFFQPPPPRLTRDPRRHDYKKKGRAVQPNITVYTLPPVFGIKDDSHPFLLRRNIKRMADYITERCAEQDMAPHNALLWACSPLYATLLETLEYRGLVYDCYQDWPDFDIHWESLLANRADVLFAASPGLVDHLAPCNTNIALLPNGGDQKLFAKADDLTLQVPAPLMHIRGPLFGYLGDVGRNVDLRPVYLAARSHEVWSFVFAGRCSQANPLYRQMKQLENVHFLGKIDRLNLPGYAAQFDVLFDLLDTEDPDEDVVPSRLYEYLMVGKPVAAMYPARFIPVYPDVIYGARSPKEFVDACYQAVLENSAWAPASRRRYGAEAAWELRAAEAERILESNGLL